MAENISCADYMEFKCYDKGLFLPFVNEYTWPIGARCFIYFVGLLWSFFGVAILADTFMCAIEKITSKTQTIKVASPESETGYEEIEVKVWNDTVANLTLMALGSSAPEILLSCIGILKNNFHADELGPSTIVGSAAFNLLVITGVCVFAIPTGEMRRIKAINVFALTSFFCVFAYLWLIIILMVISPDYVELWEAVITFLFFPIMVVLAYILDKNYCSRRPEEDGDMELGFGNVPPDEDHHHEQYGATSSTYLPWRKKMSYRLPHEQDDNTDVPEGRMTQKKMRDFIKELRKIHPDLSEEEIAVLAAKKIAEESSHDRMWYRINAIRKIGGSHKLTPTIKDDLEEVYGHLRDHDHPDSDSKMGSLADLSEGNSRTVIEFVATQSAVMERDGRVRIGIRRYGKVNCRVLFKIETIDGTAEADKDYIPLKQTMVFEVDETHKTVDVEIIDDNEWEPDEVFFVKLALDINDPSFKYSIIGKKAIQEVTIINDDEPGTFEFAKPSFLFKESAGKALIPVERANGADGTVEVKWKTEDMSAHSGKDYEGGEGSLVFDHGEMTKMLEIGLHDDQEAEKDECFRIDLTDISEGAKLGRIKKTIITIVNDDDFNGMVSRLVDMTNQNMDNLRVDNSTWGDQFRNAMNVNGGDIETASAFDYFMHFLTFGWKLIFACVPPPSIWGGWLSFIVALVFMGILTAIVGDLASIFGCMIELKDSVTAITFVALGTSLPDLFASKQAATQEKTADNSIGNVTGSNGVNVFLGLGMPWVIAAIYWTAKGQTFEVKAGTLGFSVTVYTICAVICIAMILVRRFVPRFGGGELGGPIGLKALTLVFFVLLWIAYILLSAFQAYDYIKVSF